MILAQERLDRGLSIYLLGLLSKDNTITMLGVIIAGQALAEIRGVEQARNIGRDTWLLRDGGECSGY